MCVCWYTGISQCFEQQNRRCGGCTAAADHHSPHSISLIWSGPWPYTPAGRQRLFISLTDPNWMTVAAYGTPLPPCWFCLSFTMLLQIIQVKTCQNTQVWRIKLQYVFAWSRASLCSSAPARGSKSQAASRKPRDDFANANSALSTYILYKATRPKALRLL